MGYAIECYLLEGGIPVGIRLCVSELDEECPLDNDDVIQLNGVTSNGSNIRAFRAALAV